MKKFLFKTIIICLLGVLPNLTIGILRARLKEGIPYVRNLRRLNIKQTDTIYAVTDLSHDTLGIIITKADRYSNSDIIENRTPKVLFIGDSFFGDPRISTDSGLQALTNRYFKQNLAYNIGAAQKGGFSYYNFLRDEKFIFKEPRIIICEIVERNVTDNFSKLKKEIINHSTMDFGYKNYYGLDLVFGNNLAQITQSKLINPTPMIPAAGVYNKGANNRVYFLKNKLKKLNRDNIEVIAENLSFAQNYFAARGIKIYFAIMPDKESLHPEIFGPSTLPAAQQRLSELKINIIDMYSVFSKDPLRYYYRGDTHWNYEGIKTFSKIVNDKILHDMRISAPN